MKVIKHAGPSRRILLGSALAAPLVRIGPARAAEFNYKLATGQSLAQPINARLTSLRPHPRGYEWSGRNSVLSG